MLLKKEQETSNYKKKWPGKFEKNQIECREMKKCVCQKNSVAELNHCLLVGTLLVFRVAQVFELWNAQHP